MGTVCLVSAVLLSPCAAQTPDQPKAIKLSGPQDGLYEKAEYLVDLLLVVEKGKTLTFAPGSVIRLDKYGEIRVYGTLECKGTVAENIVFLGNRKDGKGNPVPFGWNGITLDDSAARVVMENARISNSVFGLKLTSRHASVFLKEVWFSDNGTSCFTIGDSIVDITQNKAFSVTYPGPVAPAVVAAASSASGAPAAKTGFSTDDYLRRQQANATPSWRLPLRVSLGVLTAAGAGMILAGQLLAGNAQNDYDDMGPAASASEFNEAKSRRDTSILVRNIGVPCLILGALNLTLTFFY